VEGGRKRKRRRRWRLERMVAPLVVMVMCEKKRHRLPLYSIFSFPSRICPESCRPSFACIFFSTRCQATSLTRLVFFFFFFAFFRKSLAIGFFPADHSGSANVRGRKKKNCVLGVDASSEADRRFFFFFFFFFFFL
jgi:hypothetical protein